MSKRFASARAKLARAEQHRQVLQPEIEAFVESQPITLVSKHNLKGTQQPIRVSYRVTEVAKTPDHWALLAGDAIQNIRAGLDHAIWAILVKEKGVEFAEANAPKIDFPIADKASGFPKSRLVNIGVPTSLITVIEQAQPYIRLQDAPRDHPLWMLRALSNVDKHRLLHVIAMMPEEAKITTTPALANGQVEILRPGALRKNTEVVRFTGTRPAQGEVQVKCELRAGICIEATPESKAVAVDVALRTMRELAAEIIDALDPRPTRTPQKRNRRRRKR